MDIIFVVVGVILAYYTFVIVREGIPVAKTKIRRAAFIQFAFTVVAIFFSFFINWVKEQELYDQTITFNETNVSGTFDFNFWQKTYDTTFVSGNFGGLYFGNTSKPIPKYWFTGTHLISVGTSEGDTLEPIKFSVKDNKLVESVKIFDLEGNKLVDIDSNNWSRSKNIITKFNYDNRGFEICDKDDLLAFSINFPA